MPTKQQRKDSDMTVYNDVLLAVIQLAEQTNPYASIVIGPLPPDNGISIAWSTGQLETHWDKRAAVTMQAVLNGKNSNAQTVADALNLIHTTLSMTTTYPEAENYQITNISTNSPPCYIGREENNQWLYGSSLTVKFYLKGS